MKRLPFTFGVLISLTASSLQAWAYWTYAYNPRPLPPGAWYGRPSPWGTPRPYYYGVPAGANYQPYAYYYAYPVQSYGYVPPPVPNLPQGYAYPTTAPVPPSYYYPPPTYAPGQPSYGPQPPKVTTPRPALSSSDTNRVSEQEKRIRQLSAELDRVRRERDQAQDQLAVWMALGVTPEQVQAFQQRLAQLQEENTSLVHQNIQLDYKLSWFLGREQEIKMPQSLSGKVLSVDPRFGFVVLDIGGNQGVAKNGKLLVNRSGKLVAKVRVTSVQANSSVANVLPDWKLAELMEGDEVIHQ